MTLTGIPEYPSDHPPDERVVSLRRRTQNIARIGENLMNAISPLCQRHRNRPPYQARIAIPGASPRLLIENSVCSPSI